MMVRLLALLLVASPWAVAQEGITLRTAVTADRGGDTDGMRRMQRGALEVWVGDAVTTFSPDEIQSVGLEVESDGQAIVSVWLTNRAAARLSQITSSSVGKTFAVMHRETLLSAPLVEGAISNGLVMIVGLDVTEAQYIAQSLRQRIGLEDVPAPAPFSPSPPSRTESAPAPSRSPDATAESVAREFVQAIRQRQWAAVSGLLHPDSWAAVRADALAMLRFDGGIVLVRDGNTQAEFAAANILGRPLSERRPADLSNRDLAALQLAALDALGVWGPPRAPREVIGDIEDGDRLHVLLRSRSASDGVSDVSAVTMRRDGTGAWRVLFTEARGY